LKQDAFRHFQFLLECCPWQYPDGDFCGKLAGAGSPAKKSRSAKKKEARHGASEAEDAMPGFFLI
jgi:hypothetical protein